MFTLFPFFYEGYFVDDVYMSIIFVEVQYSTIHTKVIENFCQSVFIIHILLNVEIL